MPNNTSQSDPRGARGLAPLAGPAALALLALAALPLLWSAGVRLAALLSYPYPSDGLEGTLLYEARLLRKFILLLTPYWPAMLLAGALIVRAIRDERALVPVCQALVAPISLLGAGETGANHNHLLESLLALALCVGSAAGWMAQALGRHHPAAQLLLGLLAGQIALAFQPQEWYVGELAPADPPQRYLSYIRQTRGEILADDVGLLVAAGRPLRYDDPSTMGPAARSGVWDQSGLIQDIAERHFSAILVPTNVEHNTIDATGRWTPEMLAAIREHYRLVFRDTIYTYVPK